MGSMLDAIGALVVGGMVLISIFTAMFNVNSLGHDLNMEYALMKNAERVVAGIDSVYLSKVGLYLGEGTHAIVKADSNEFEFIYKVSPASVNEDSILFFCGDSTENGFPFEIKRNSNTELGPFWLVEKAKFDYYDKYDNITASLDSISSIQVDMNFTYDFYSSGSSGANVRYKTIFWKCFKNLYL